MKKITAILCVLSLVIALGGCFKVSVSIPDVIKNETSAPVTQPTLPAQPSETVPQYTTEPETVTEAMTTAVQETTTQPVIKTPLEMNNEELLKYFTDTLNTVKYDRLGFKKSKLTSILDLKLSNSLANSLVSFVKGALLSDTADETNVSRGEPSDGIMSPPGKSYACDLSLTDITGIKAETSGGDYVITVNVKDETNPVDGGTLSKIFDFMTVDDVVNIYAPKVGATVARDDIEVKFDGCYAKLTVTADGKIKDYTTYVKGVMNMNNATIKKGVTIKTDLAITLASTTTYTDFIY